MKEAYSKPVAEVKEFKAQDVMTTSQGPEIINPGDDD